ncbi:response regulator [Myxococcota bacterium]|nr:response regulator [Myxococcota bacterium]
MISNEHRSILVVDDEMVIREVLEDFLSAEGYEVVTVSSGANALLELEEEHYDAILSDLMMPQMNGLELMTEINNRGYQLVKVIMTGYGTIETAVQAMKVGADDYILKPFKMEEVLSVLDRGFDRQRLLRENITLRETVNLYRIAETIAHESDSARILQEIAEASWQETQADYLYLSIFPTRAPQWDPGSVLRTGPLAGSSLTIDEQAVIDLLTREPSLLAQGADGQVFIGGPDLTAPPVSFCAVPLMVPGRMLGLLAAASFTRRTIFTEGHRKFLHILATKAAAALENTRLVEQLQGANRELLEANRQLQENFQQSILGFARAIEQNDPYTRGHSDRVAQYSRIIAAELALDASIVEDIFFAGQLHDIGKIGISSQKLNKAGKLNAPEIRMFRRHPEMGKQILEPIPFMRHLISGVYCHHERYDGQGYPQGLCGEEIPLMGRIIAVADTYDAMTSDRSYRKALPMQVAVEELRANSGTQFDPMVVQSFLAAVAKGQIHE